MLMKRGMPPHPRIDEYIRDVVVGHEIVNGMKGDIIKCEGAHDDDKRDLITMHALRWVASEHSGNSAAWIIDHYKRTSEFNVALHEDGDNYNGHGDTILDAILMATAHLDKACS
jgi:hypothetical protein